MIPATTTTTTMTHYQVLNVSPEASMEEIKTAFRQLALETHPDKNPHATSSSTSFCEEEFRRIQQAWECLRDSRSQYDQELQRESNRMKCKQESAMMVSLVDDMEEAVDDETNTVVYIYTCRCGDEIQVWSDEIRIMIQEKRQSLVLVECPGCSFAYSIHR